ncbi:MAG TPA: FHA domain-containing protein [Steroidobacteraceae bacterium]|nr:FHA domain-containing protein [Steroidobacteraceae bacterium]
MYGIHLDHHTLSIARDGELLACEPLAVETTEGEARAGAAALATARGRPDEVSLNHWRELGRNEIAARNVAREMIIQLRTLGITERIDAVVAVPADLDPGVLATLRGALHAAGVDTRDFVDSAALGAAAIAERGHYVLLEAGWRSATATRVAGGGECAFEEAFVSERANLLDVYDLWLIAVASAMVKNTRFDPLLSLVFEQQLFASLPQVAARAAIEGRAEAVLEDGGSRFAVEVDAQMLAAAAQPFYRELARLARSARIAGQSAALVLPAESRRWPGFLAGLLEYEQDGVVITPAGLIAVAASLQAADPAGTPRLRRRVARIADHSLASNVEYLSSVAASPARALPVTHVLYGGDSMRFPDVGLSIGTEEDSNTPHITLPRAAAGVSRRHCSLRREGEATVLIDHSRFGTWINGARVRERAMVRPGDRIRVGTPGVEFTLISAAAFAREVSAT